VTVVPVTSLPGVFELSYYANAVLPIFATESVIGETAAAVDLLSSRITVMVIRSDYN